MEFLDTFNVNGIEYGIVLAEQEVVDPGPPPVGYAEDGFSYETKLGCCVRCKVVDDILDNAIANGDEIERTVAENMPRWFALYLPSRTYTDDIRQLMVANWNRSYTWGSMRFGNFYIDDVVMEGVSMVRTGFAMDRMGINLNENFGLRFRTEVNEARRQVAATGLDIVELYRKK